MSMLYAQCISTDMPYQSSTLETQQAALNLFPASPRSSGMHQDTAQELEELLGMKTFSVSPGGSLDSAGVLSFAGCKYLLQSPSWCEAATD